MDGYIRVSKIGGREGEGFIAPGVQRDQIRAWATVMGAEIAAWHEDLDVSGQSADRPAFQAALERIRTGQTGGLVVARLDRFARSAVDGGRIVREITGHGAVFASAGERLDPTTPVGKAMLQIMFAMAELELDRIREGWGQATRRAVERGVHGHAPFGYVKAGRGEPLIPDPAAAPVVRELFARRAAGGSWMALARWLDSQCPPVRGEQWTRRAVETIIANRAYTGEARYGEHVNPAAHEPVVGLDEWEAAQHARAVRPTRGEPALLSGLIRCAGCRHRMQASVVGQSRMLVYRCKRRHGTGDCPAPASVRRSLVDAHVEAAFLHRYGDVAAEGRQADAGLGAAQQRVADAEAELAAYRDAPIREALERLGPGAYHDGLASRADAIVKAREEFAAARARSAGIDVGAGADVWESLAARERRQLLAEGIDCVMLRRTSTPGRSAGFDAGRVRVLWRGEAPDGLPGPGVRVDLAPFEW